MDLDNEMLQRITRVETKVDNMDKKLDHAIAANETAVEALTSSKSAHHRLNKIEDNQTWLWRTTIAALIVGAVNILWKGIGA